jgi:hypothetical protein
MAKTERRLKSQLREHKIHTPNSLKLISLAKCKIVHAIKYQRRRDEITEKFPVML